MALIDDLIRITRIVAGNAGKRIKVLSEVVGNEKLYTLTFRLLGSVPGADAIPVTESDPVTSVTIKDPNDDTRKAIFDSKFKALLVQQIEHSEIHEGNHFYISDFETEALNGTIEFVVTVPDVVKEPHMIFKGSGTSGVSFEIFENVTNVVGGSPVTLQNSNRNSLNTSIMTVLKDPSSVVTPSPRIWGQTVGSNRTAGLVGRAEEMDLKRNTTYLFRLTSLGAGNVISYLGSWYEHTPS